MKHPFLKIALLAGAAFLIVNAVKKTKEIMKKQAEADAEMAEEAAAQAQAEEMEETAEEAVEEPETTEEDA